MMRCWRSAAPAQSSTVRHDDEAEVPVLKRSRADLVVWFALGAIAAIALTSLRPGGLPLQWWGLRTGTEPQWAPAALAAAVAVVVIAGRRRLETVPWTVLQLSTVVTSAVWATALIQLRNQQLGEAEVGTYAGDALRPLLATLTARSSWAAAAVLALLFGVAMALLNAAVQSLAGAVQARRLVPALVLSPGAAFLADGLQVTALLSACAVLALSAMASERGRGLLWSTGLGLLSGVLLFAGALTGFACTAVGVGMLCIYFLRRRSLMIIVAGLGVLVSLLAAAAFGWSWPEEFGAASALRLAQPEILAASVVLTALVVAALGGPTLRESWRKVRGTPAWPVMLTGLVAGVLAALTHPAGVGVIPAVALWLPLLGVAASAPQRAAGAPEGPEPAWLAVTAAVAVGAGLLAGL